MSWANADASILNFKKTFALENEEFDRFVVRGNNVICNGQLYWEDGAFSPTKASHLSRLVQFKEGRSVPLIMVKGLPYGGINVFVSMKTRAFIGACSARQLRVLSPQPDLSERSYGTELLNLDTEGSTLSARVCASATELLNNGKLKL